MGDETRKMPEGFDWRAFTPEDSPKTPMDVHAEPLHQKLATAEVQQGEPAYFFNRPIFDFTSGTKVETGSIFDLGERSKTKPVALIFGSYT
jgi:hypothetical protein